MILTESAGMESDSTKEGGVPVHDNSTLRSLDGVGVQGARGFRHMKRILYGTTALVAAGLAAGEAAAASGLKLGITGFYNNSIGASFGKSAPNPVAAGG